MIKKLFLLTTKGLGDFYVIATDPTSAVTNLKNVLDEDDYGYSVNRDVTEIKIIATTTESHKTKNPSVDTYNRLLIL